MDQNSYFRIDGEFMKNLFRSLILTTVLFTTLQMHALVGGCVDSPENPTAILALVGTAGVLAVKLYYYARR